MEPLGAERFKDPAVLLSGSVDETMYGSFREQLAAAPGEGLVVIEVSTLGGDPEVARMMGEDVRFHSDHSPARRFVFLGKAAVYSAGTTFMAFFARPNRYLARGTRLMIHERRLTKTVNLDGPLTTCVPNVEATLNEIRESIEIQYEGFRNLIEGSDIPFEEIAKRATSDWYIEAQEAKERGLVEAVL